jgi:predicted RNA-binding Zn ribbon-like protein
MVGVVVTYHIRTMVSSTNPGKSPPPHELDLVIDFVNTLDVEEHTDAIEGPRELGDWLAGHGLLDSGRGAVGASEHARALKLREALRELMLEHNGAPASRQAGAELEAAARRGRLGVHFDATGAVLLTAAAPGADGALARLLVPVARAAADGSWRRVKACRAADCTWAFYDRSRNRAGVWCDMAVCGNRTKVRSYRERTYGRGS